MLEAPLYCQLYQNKKKHFNLAQNLCPTLDKLRDITALLEFFELN